MHSCWWSVRNNEHIEFVKEEQCHFQLKNVAEEQNKNITEFVCCDKVKCWERERSYYNVHYWKNEWLQQQFYRCLYKEDNMQWLFLFDYVLLNSEQLQHDLDYWRSTKTCLQQFVREGVKKGDCRTNTKRKYSVTYQMRLEQVIKI